MSRREFTGAIAGTIVLFIASLAVAIVATHTYPAIGDGFVTLFRDAILGDINGDTSAMLAAKVFLNNLQACIILFLGGASLGLLTAFVLAANGLVIGAIIEVVREERGLVFVLAAILPHGIFEVPAFVIAGALGFLLARGLWQDLQGTGDANVTALRLGRHFVTIVVPLIAVAAIIEAFITPEIIQLLA